MDPVGASIQGTHLPPPFHTREFHHHLSLHHHLQLRHQQLQQHQQQPNSDDDTGGAATTGLNRGLKREHDDNPLPDGATNNSSTSNNENNNNSNNNGGGEGSSGDGGGGGEFARRTRGRPAGSKNKPKPPIIITRDSPNALRTHLMEIASGCDVGETVAAFARRRQRGVCVLSGSGTVTNLHGSFEILSLSGSFLPPPAPLDATGFAVYLSGGQGQVIGGSVVGALISSGPVVLLAASFGTAAYERLPLDDGDEPLVGPLESPAGLVAPPLPPPPLSQHQQQLSPDVNTMLFQSLPPNLLSRVQVPPEVYPWASGGAARPSY
ncbi:unnamed protein product [Spirodela intermedia]|uniref:PPC domain-containing protein n=1 Tax=Spirodela intermedia TaxID=51605 RepID=A0A7I8JV24_SPIIN|nr:unnamed protein product [Spirodela intermedia]CAA6673615.1 unnamed protein product [Spirodela intermedia]